MRSKAVAVVATLLTVVIGCGRQRAAPSQPPPPKVTVLRPVESPAQGYYEYNGYLEPVETYEARARVKGFLNEVRFRDGEEVKAGALLYEIDPREYKTSVARCTADVEKFEADILNAEAQIKVAGAEAERTNRLTARSAVSLTDQEKAVATLSSLKAQRAAAVANKDAALAALHSAELDLGYTKIHSPIDGRVSRSLVTKGNLVGQNETTLLTTVVSVDPLYVYFDIPERDLVGHDWLVSAGADSDTSEVPIEVGVANEEGYPHRGQLDFQENRVDTGTGTVRMRGRIPNPVVKVTGSRRLYPGLFARVRVPAGAARSLPVIPEDALMTGQEGRYVYVVGPKDLVEKRTVTVGPIVWKAGKTSQSDSNRWLRVLPKPPAPASGEPAPGAALDSTVPVRSVVAIERGLELSDRVIVNGLQRARPGTPVTPEQWEMHPPTN